MMLDSENEAIHIEEPKLEIELELEQDQVVNSTPKVLAPWRRYFARALDFSIYTLFIVTIQALVLNVNIANQTSIESLFGSFFVFFMMILIEPLLLSLFGTTPGKWLLGLSVTDNEGQKLTYVDALSRTVTLFWRGYGLNIPIYSLIRLWIGYKECKTGELLDWECDSIIHLKDEKKWRIGAYIAAQIVWLALFVLIFNLATMPKNRGELTVTEFSENYNRLADYLEIDSSKVLNDDGQWVTRESDENVLYLLENDPPIYNFIEKNGNMTGMTFKVELRNNDGWITGYKNEIMLSILSFVRAQPGNSLTSRDVIDLIKQIAASPLEDFQFTSHGVMISCDYEYSGYMGYTDYGTLFPTDDDEERYFSIEFKMAK